MNSFVNQMQSQNQNQYQMGGINFNPYQPQWNMPQQNRLYSYKADPIQGESAAWQFPMGPNSDIWLPDANDDIVWWIRSDMHGNKTVTGFDISLHQKPQPVDTNDLAARKLDYLIDHVEKEIEHAEEKIMSLESSGYDMNYILQQQEQLKKAYADKIRKLNMQEDQFRRRGSGNYANYTNYFTDDDDEENYHYNRYDRKYY